MANIPVKPLPKDSIRIGVPISYPVYDSSGNLLLQAGMVVETESQLERLISRGLFMDQKTSQMLSEQGSGGKGSFESDKVKEDAPIERDVLVELPIKNLKLGETFQITPLNDDTGSTKYFIKYIGGMEKKSLICTLPTIDEKIVFIKENSGFSVRIFSGKNVFKFNTVVDAVFSRPYPHMHLKFPRETYSNQIRKNQRIAANIIASIENKSNSHNQDKIAAKLTDMSLGGAQIESFKSIGELNDQIECTFKINMEGGEALFVIPSVLRRASETTHSDGRQLFSYGIQFLEIGFQDRIVLQSYIFQALTGEKLDEL